MKIEDKLFLTPFRPDEAGSHLVVKSQQVCAGSCPAKACTLFCPAQVYKWEDEQLVVGYNACLECGACRVACPHANLDWRYPRGGFGVQYRYG